MVPCFFQIAYLSENIADIAVDMNVWKFIAHMYKIGISQVYNGGVFGGIIMTPIVTFFGITGAYIVAVTASLLCLYTLQTKVFWIFW